MKYNYYVPGVPICSFSIIVAGALNVSPRKGGMSLRTAGNRMA